MTKTENCSRAAPPARRVKVAGSQHNADDMLPEYDFRGGVRGKYAERYRQRPPAQIIAQIASKSIRHRRVETSSRDHDEVLYGKTKEK
jgi:hypothetical protein